MPCIIGPCMFMNCDHMSGLKLLPLYRSFEFSASLLWISTNAWMFFSRYVPIIPCMALP